MTAANPDTKGQAPPNDQTTTIEQLKQAMVKFRDQRDWRQFHTPKNLAMGVAIEAAELMEHFQWITVDKSEEVVHDPQQRRQIGEELADVMSYLLCLASVMDLDVAQTFLAKLERNAEKYPVEKCRGKYKVL